MLPGVVNIHKGKIDFLTWGKKNMDRRHTMCIFINLLHKPRLI